MYIPWSLTSRFSVTVHFSTNAFPLLYRTYVFRTQSQEIKERGGNQTSGIDFFITQERIIFLDTQVGDFGTFVLAHKSQSLGF